MLKITEAIMAAMAFQNRLFQGMEDKYSARPWPMRFNGKKQWKRRCKRPSA